MPKKDGASLDDLIRDMNKKEGETIVTKGLGEYNYDRIPFTSPRLNYMTFGGLPKGKLIEFFGEEHGGKTTTALDIISNYQQMNDPKKVLYIDAENTLDVKWAQTLGVNTDENFVLMQPQSQTAEDIFQFIIDAVDTNEVGLWVLDSIGVLFSAQEYEKGIADSTYAGISKPLTKFSKRIQQIMHATKCTGIGINQVRDKLNSPWGGVDTPGGRAWKHACAVRMQFSKGSFYDENDKTLSRGGNDPVGNMVKVFMEKNKTCPPVRHNAEYSLNYELGADYYKDLTELAIQYEFINKSGAWFTIINPETGEVIGEKIQGQNNVKKYLEEQTEVTMMIEAALDSIIKNG